MSTHEKDELKWVKKDCCKAMSKYEKKHKHSLRISENENLYIYIHK